MVVLFIHLRRLGEGWVEEEVWRIEIRNLFFESSKFEIPVENSSEYKCQVNS